MKRLKYSKEEKNLDVVVVDEDSILSGEVAPTIEQTIQLIENLGVDGEAIEKAPHPMMMFSFECDRDIPVDALLRKAL